MNFDKIVTKIFINFKFYKNQNSLPFKYPNSDVIHSYLSFQLFIACKIFDNKAFSTSKVKMNYQISANTSLVLGNCGNLRKLHFGILFCILKCKIIISLNSFYDTLDYVFNRNKFGEHMWHVIK